VQLSRVVLVFTAFSGGLFSGFLLHTVVISLPFVCRRAVDAKA